jgi:hypothetical protein
MWKNCGTGLIEIDSIVINLGYLLESVARFEGRTDPVGWLPEGSGILLKIRWSLGSYVIGPI